MIPPLINPMKITNHVIKFKLLDISIAGINKENKEELKESNK